MHWNASGEVDGYGSRFAGAFGMPLLTLGIYLLFVILPQVDPRRQNYDKFAAVYELLKWAIILFLAVMYFVTLTAGLGFAPNVGLITKLGVGILLVILGNYFGKLRHNYFVGIKTPWTLANEEVWVKTHRFAGPLWMLAGLVFIITAFFDHPATFWVAMGGIFLASILSVVYSFWLFRRLS
jgi:uncharacterized membrane protein